jgi:hypothetical protein
MAHGSSNKCIGTSTAPYVDKHDFPRVDNPESVAGGYNDHAGAPGYGMGPDGRRRARRFTLAHGRAVQINSMAGVDVAQGVVGRSTVDGRWPKYTEILDYIPACD